MLQSITSMAVMVMVAGPVMSIITKKVARPGLVPNMTEEPQPTSLFQRVDVVSLDQLVVLGSVAEPYSCWCDNPGATCPIHIPNSPLHQVMNVTCGDGNVHCCLERVPDQSQQHSLLMASHNITTAQELGNFLDFIIDTLWPYENKTLMGSLAKESEVLSQVKRNLSVDIQDITKKKLNNPDIRRPAHTLEDDFLVALKDIAEYLLTLTGQHWNIDTARSNTTVISVQKRDVQEFNNLSKYYSYTGTEDIKTKHSPGLYNISNIIEKGDFVLPYGTLGWFSKAVELAFDGSLYVGLALAVMLFAASLLTGGMTFLGDTCFICSIIGYVNTISTP